MERRMIWGATNRKDEKESDIKKEKYENGKLLKIICLKSKH